MARYLKGYLVFSTLGNRVENIILLLSCSPYFVEPKKLLGWNVKYSSKNIKIRNAILCRYRSFYLTFFVYKHRLQMPSKHVCPQNTVYSFFFFFFFTVLQAEHWISNRNKSRKDLRKVKMFVVGQQVSSRALCYMSVKLDNTGIPPQRLQLGSSNGHRGRGRRRGSPSDHSMKTIILVMYNKCRL